MKAKAKKKVVAPRTRSRGKSPKPKARSPKANGSRRWLQFVERHGIVLASARGKLPNIAEQVAGEPIVGSWWAHPKGKAIFAALSELDDSLDVRCFKLVDGKITLVHRRLWPALVALGKAGVLPAARLASLQQEHMPTGEHRNLVTPFPDWVDDETARMAETLSAEQARVLLRNAV